MACCRRDNCNCRFEKFYDVPWTFCNLQDDLELTLALRGVLMQMCFSLYLQVWRRSFWATRIVHRPNVSICIVDWMGPLFHSPEHYDCFRQNHDHEKNADDWSDQLWQSRDDYLNRERVDVDRPGCSRPNEGYVHIHALSKWTICQNRHCLNRSWIIGKTYVIQDRKIIQLLVLPIRFYAGNIYRPFQIFFGAVSSPNANQTTSSYETHPHKLYRYICIEHVRDYNGSKLIWTNTEPLCKGCNASLSSRYLWHWFDFYGERISQAVVCAHASQLSDKKQ